MIASSSAPGIGALTAEPPVATKICLAVSVLIVFLLGSSFETISTFTLCGASSDARPSKRFTPAEVSKRL